MNDNGTRRLEETDGQDGPQEVQLAFWQRHIVPLCIAGVALLLLGAAGLYLAFGPDEAAAPANIGQAADATAQPADASGPAVAGPGAPVEEAPQPSAPSGRAAEPEGDGVLIPTRWQVWAYGDMRSDTAIGFLPPGLVCQPFEQSLTGKWLGLDCGSGEGMPGRIYVLSLDLLRRPDLGLGARAGE